MVRIEMYNLQTRLLQFKDQKKLKMYLIVRIELSSNENTLKGRKCLKCFLYFKDIQVMQFIDQQKVIHNLQIRLESFTDQTKKLKNTN